VFFVRVHDLDGIEDVLKDFAGGEARKVEQSKRACFYVGATRAMVRQYITGVNNGRFVRTAAEYTKALTE
jgi:hypothetical protein